MQQIKSIAQLQAEKRRLINQHRQLEIGMNETWKELKQTAKPQQVTHAVLKGIVKAALVAGGAFVVKKLAGRLRGKSKR